MPAHRTATAHATVTDIRDLPHGQALLAAVPRWTGGTNRTHQIGIADRDEVTWAQADERTTAIAAKLAVIRSTLGALTDLVDEAVALIETAWGARYDRVLGYPTFEAYVADRFGDLGVVRMPAQERLRVVLALMGAEDDPRMSGRGAARVTAVDEGTIRRDLRSVGRASNPRKMRQVKAPTTSVVLQTLNALAVSSAGLTILEAMAVMKRGYGSVSGALSALEAQGHIARAGEVRGGYNVYVLASALL